MQTINLSTVGKVGVAVSMLAPGVNFPSAYVAYAADSPNIAPHFLVTSGIPSVRDTGTLGVETEETNQFTFNGFKSSSDEYAKSSYITLNGSLLEVEPMRQSPYDYSKVDEVLEVNIRVQPHSVFEIEEEEIVFTQEFVYDFTKTESIDVNHYGRFSPNDNK